MKPALLPAALVAMLPSLAIAHDGGHLHPHGSEPMVLLIGAVLIGLSGALAARR